MTKIFGFLILWRLVGNPFLAILILLAIVYFLDRRYVGIFPSVTKPFKRMSKISKLRSHIAMSPNDVSSKYELARLLMERKQYQEVLRLLESIQSRFEQSAEFWDDFGTVHLRLGNISTGEQYILQGLSLNHRVKYGQPYLRLAEVYKSQDHDKAMKYVRQFQEIHSSSSEGYYLLGLMYKSLGRATEAKAAFQESINNYRSLPRYKKREERKWAVRSMYNKMK